MDLIGSIEATEERNVERLGVVFREFLTLPMATLARKKGDWKFALTAQVIKFARRKGVVEELELYYKNWNRLCESVLHTKETTDGAPF